MFSRHVTITTVLNCLFFSVALACNSNNPLDCNIIGKWQSANAHFFQYRKMDIEFFEDKTCVLYNNNIDAPEAGKWTFLNDGRLKIYVEGIAATVFLGKLNGETLSIFVNVDKEESFSRVK